MGEFKMSCIRNNKFDSAYELYLTGISLAKVGAILGMRRQVLFDAFKRRGWTMRKPNAQPEQMFNGKKFTKRVNGYFSLTTDDRISMHRYVWEHHNGPIPEGWDIHHKDEDKTNNAIDNLECLPKSEHTSLYSPHNNQFGKGGRPIIMMDLTGKEVRRFDKTSIAAKELGVDMSAIRVCLVKPHRTSCGHKWKYA